MAHPRFEDIFSLKDIQRLQDAFAEAANVASIIAAPDGRPLTRPSRFTALCRDVVHKESRGLACCILSQKRLGLDSRRGPVIDHCANTGLLNGATAIFFDERHIATWIIGQVADESADTATVLAYATDIGADPEVFREALARVPRMSRTRFTKVCEALHRFAGHLSALARKNHRQAELIRDLHAAKDHLRVRDRTLADIIDFLPDPTLVVDEKGAVIFWNKAMERLTGVAAVDMLGKSHFAYGAPFYGTPAPLLIDYARGAVGQPDARYAVASMDVDSIIAEVAVAALPGGPRHIWAKAVALRDVAGRIVGGIETIRDVTDRHLADMALRESEENFRRIVETANEGVWVVDADQKTTFVNRRMATMLGYTPEEMAGRDIEPFVADDSLQAMRRQLGKLRQGQSNVFEHRLRTRSGEDLWALVSASPLYDASGAYLGTLGMLTDITARKKVEEELAGHRLRLEEAVEIRTRELREQAMELAEANIRLSELDRLKSSFLSTVSHELRTPLTSILGFAKLIARDFGDHFLQLADGNPALENRGKRVTANLAVVHSEAERLTRLINDVLDLSRIESGNMFWRDARFAPAAVLEKAAGSIRGLLGQRPELTFVFETAADIPELCMDPDQLIQVAENLLQNAVKFTRSGTVRMAARRDGDALLLTVADTGIGIPAGELEAIFGKFHQVGRGDTMGLGVKGTGLGLAICRQIVRHYGGRIWAASEPGQGSVFTVRLPGCAPDWEARTPDAAMSGQTP